MTKQILYKRSINDNFADLESLKSCIEIIKKKHCNEENIKNILKLYFINYANFWRNDYEERNNTKDSTHLSSIYRTDQVRLHREFYIAFPEFEPDPDDMDLINCIFFIHN